MISKRKIAWLALVVMVVMALPLSAISPLPVQEAQAAYEAPVVEVLEEEETPLAANPYAATVDGKPMTSDPMLTAYNGVTYVSLRSVITALTPGAQVTWNGATATAYKEGVLSLTAVPGQDYIVANGRYLPVDTGVIAQGGAVLLPLDVVVKAADARYSWQNGTVAFTTGSGGILSGDQFYNADDLYWLSHIIYAESGNQPLSGKIAVGNVVLNRVENPQFPNSVYGVIFQRNQFSPVKNGTIKRTPNAESVMAAKLCLDGAVELDGVLWFNRAGLKSWASRNRTFVATIAQHSFYA